MAWRGACKPEHYNLDYSRFNQFDQDEDGDQPAGPASFYQQAMRNPNLPPELREAFYLSQVAKETGDMEKQKRADELVRKAISSGGPEIQARFKQSLGEMQQDPKFQQKAQELKLQMPSAEAFLAGDADSSPADLKQQIERKLMGTNSALDNLLQQQAKLEAIAESKDPAMIDEFFKSQGWTDEQVQRAMQEPEYAMELFSSKLPSMVTDGVDRAAEKASQECEEVLDAIHAVFPDQPKGKVKQGAAAVPALPEATVHVSREGAEEVVVVRFPTVVRSMADVELDVAPGILRCYGAAFAEMIVPLPDDVDTDGVQGARFSKKRSELTVRLPVRT